MENVIATNKNVILMILSLLIYSDIINCIFLNGCNNTNARILIPIPS